MIDVNWDDNAKAAVNTYNDWALENDLGIHAFFEHLTNNGHTQPKTVADAVEQDGVKWTHIDTDGEPCKILIDAPDSLGRVIILRGNGWYMPVDRANLKPIKPTISKADAWDKLLQTDEKIRKLDDAIFAIADKYEII